ncbi:hypothetical protein JXA88_13615 [Candidatus Fermentibacteria bacterium]|nr:hypothetical protein [Candidatus Fermentibacteria bacterium]
MWRAACRRIGILCLAAIGLSSGCSVGTPRDIEIPATADLLLGHDRSAALATRIGRSDWPATYGPLEGPEDTIYVEYYRDYQGNGYAERSNPRRLFRSYRIGTQHR